MIDYRCFSKQRLKIHFEGLLCANTCCLTACLKMPINELIPLLIYLRTSTSLHLALVSLCFFQKISKSLPFSSCLLILQLTSSLRMLLMSSHTTMSIAHQDKSRLIWNNGIALLVFNLQVVQLLKWMTSEVVLNGSKFEPSKRTLLIKDKKELLTTLNLSLIHI